VNDDDVFGSDVEEFGQVSHRPARVVHETQGLGKNETCLPEFGFGHRRVGFVALQFCALALCQNVDHHLTDVVAVARVAGPGVTEPDYEKGVVTQLQPRQQERRSLQRCQLRSQQPKRLVHRRLGPWLRQQEG
jgi:hypothetical protein